MTPEEAALIVDMIDAGWSRMRQETALLYVQNMLDLPYEVVAQVLKDLMAQSDYRPSIAAIRRGSAAALGLMPPTEAEALEQAVDYLRYKGQLMYVNGSGYRPEEPRVHPAVKAACAPLDAEDNYWPTMFKRFYPEQADLAAQKILSSNMTEMRALESGDA